MAVYISGAVWGSVLAHKSICLPLTVCTALHSCLTKHMDIFAQFLYLMKYSFSAFVIFSWVSWGLWVFVCLAVGAVLFPVCERSHSNVQLCLPKHVRLVYVICSNVCPWAFAVGSEDFTLSRSAISVLSGCLHGHGFPALWLQHPQRTGGQPTAGSQCGVDYLSHGISFFAVACYDKLSFWVHRSGAECMRNSIVQGDRHSILCRVGVMPVTLWCWVGNPQWDHFLKKCICLVSL